MSPFDDLEVCRSILESLPIGLCIVDLRKKIAIWSAGAERITGQLRHEVVGHYCVNEPLLHCDQPGCEFCSENCPVARAMKTSHSAESSGSLHHKAGHDVPVRVQAVPVLNHHGFVIGGVEIFEEIHQAAYPDHRDYLRPSSTGFESGSGFGTHAMTEMYLLQALATLSESQIPFGLLVLRIEGLQHFRAKFGPEAASSFLRTMARTLAGALWTSDYVGRWTDDQFLIILSACREEALPPVRERIRRTLAGKSIEWWGERHSLPISIGEAAGQPGDTLESILHRAQQSLHSASSLCAAPGSPPKS
jgi:diguanylate cyclase (GGDEF)-like protein/PAS domain S-box-containing protein